MRTRLEKKREGIVSLTQTELMLVLTVVVLLLLLIKHADLSRVCAAAPEACRTMLSQQSPQNTAQAKTISDEELAQEVTSDLTRNAQGASASGNSPSPLAAATSASDAQQTAHNALRDDNVRLRDENATLRKQNADLQKTLDEALTAARDAASDASAPAPEPTSSPTSTATPTATLTDEVGFIPCWLGEGNPRYYIAFDLTYDKPSDTFRIKPHRHLQSGAGIVQSALSGDLRVLLDYPKTIIGRTEFLNFARKIESARKRMYKKDCQLAVTINKKNVDLTVTNDFINAQTKLYPVARN